MLRETPIQIYVSSSLLPVVPLPLFDGLGKSPESLIRFGLQVDEGETSPNMRTLPAIRVEAVFTESASWSELVYRGRKREIAAGEGSSRIARNGEYTLGQGFRPDKLEAVGDASRAQVDPEEHSSHRTVPGRQPV